MTVIDVALALVCLEGRWLVDRRGGENAFAGLWEFPGGKVKPGESPAQAAIREAGEELGIVVEATGVLRPVEHDYGDRVVRLHPVTCRLMDGHPTPSDDSVIDVRWVQGDELLSLDMPAANRALLPIIDSLDSTPG